MSDQPTHPRAAGQTSSRLGQETRSRFDLYSEITTRVMDMLESGVVPWRSPILGQVRAGRPKNLTSGKAYRGVNVFLLAFTAFARGFESAYWLTYKQTRERGGGVKKGEKGSLVVFWKPHEVIDKQSGEVKQTFLLRYYHVFNLDQCVDIKAPDAPVYTPSQFDPIEAAEQIVDGYDDGPQIVFGGGRAFYRPSTDTVSLPERERFTSGEEFYSTLFHELAHSTGHSKRLDRGLDTDLQPLGSPDYGKEELIAEMSAAFLCGECGIAPSVIQNQSSYISGWLGKLKSDKMLVLSSAGAAQRAADWILGRMTDAEVEAAPREVA